MLAFRSSLHSHFLLQDFQLLPRFVSHHSPGTLTLPPFSACCKVAASAARRRSPATSITTPPLLVSGGGGWHAIGRSRFTWFSWFLTAPPLPRPLRQPLRLPFASSAPPASPRRRAVTPFDAGKEEFYGTRKRRARGWKEACGHKLTCRQVEKAATGSGRLHQPKGWITLCPLEEKSTVNYPRSRRVQQLGMQPPASKARYHNIKEALFWHVIVVATRAHPTKKKTPYHRGKRSGIK